MSSQSFAEFLKAELDERRWSRTTLVNRAAVSFRAISDALSGNLERLLENKNIPTRKKNGISGSTYRILRALEEEPKEWMDKLGLEIPKNEEIEQKFETNLRQILSQPFTAEDIELFGRLQKDLGELLTVEMALRVLIKKRLGV